MKSGDHSRWPLVLLLGLCVSVLVGSAVAVAEPSRTGRPSWHDDEPARVTGTVLATDAKRGTITLDGLVTYDPVRAGIGVLTVEAAPNPSGASLAEDAIARLRQGDTIDVVITRDDGRWIIDSVTLLDTD